MELIKIQSELKAPKNQFNSFGKYKYRSCEDILESLKPILKELSCFLVLKDSVENIGCRYYIKATATLYNKDNKIIAETTAFAREEEDKKGMDGSQITGASSSYARKYALNGLFAIDDNNDSDTTNNKKEQKATPTLEDITAYMRDKNYTTFPARRLYDYYEVRNWLGKDGKPITNWKATVDYWDKQQKEKEGKNV